MAKRLKRNQENKVVAGVMSGMADYFEQDPVLFRILAIIFLILTGIFPGLLFYIVAWIIMPAKKLSEVEYEVVS